ncbi:MAG: ABC transporter ATP-binding protein [Nitriliruptoraceae bacterium]
MAAPLQLQRSTGGSSAPAIVADRLTKRFDGLVAVDDLSLEVARGGVVGFVGPNGAGKSTTIRMLLGLVRPTSGTAEVLGTSIDHPHRLRGRIGALIEAPAFYPQLSGLDNLRVHASLGAHPDRRVHEVLELVGLGERSMDRYGTYSLGMKQRLGLATALLGEPDLLVLDEPTNGLDPEGIIEVRRLLKDLGSTGTTVLVSSHQLGEIQAACDRIVVIRRGQLVFDGSVRDALTQGSESVLVVPEHRQDRPRLAGVLLQAGYDLDDADDGLRVRTAGHHAPALNRLASDAGITLRELTPLTGTLEDAFFDLTRDGRAFA